MLEFFITVGRLKTLSRQGWVDRGILDGESVADHTYRVAMMAWVMGAQAGLDVDRLLKIALVHDLPEAVVGDATPYTEIVAAGTDVGHAVAHWRELLTADELAAAKGRKHTREAHGLDRISRLLSGRSAEELTLAWHDYTARSSTEARFVGQIDKLEALLQAMEYREAGQPADVESFLQSAREAVEHPVLLVFLMEIEGRIQQASSAEGTDGGNNINEEP